MPISTQQSGSPAASALLQGWTIPLRRVISGRPGYFHHTYVTSDRGDSWGCAGRDRGGQAIYGGRADVNIARCLAGPDGRAGIFYGLTGVCHQIANRILHPAGRTTVQGAQGYAFTIGIFGQYGIGPWPQLMACYGSDASIGAAGLADSGGALAVRTDPHPSQDAQRRRIERSTMVDVDFQDRAQDLRKLILGHAEASVPVEVAQRVVERHRLFWAYQHGLVESLVTDRIDRSQYLEHFNDGLSALMSADRQILGDRAYTAIFGSAFDPADSMIDAEMFLAGGPDEDLDREAQAGPMLR